MAADPDRLAPPAADAAMTAVRNRVMGRAGARSHPDSDALIDAYAAFIPTLEQTLWAHDCDEALLARYQAAHRQMEQLLAGGGGADPRHKFVVVIPVADRPQQLEGCLDSLVRLCELYAYGGRRDGRYPKVAVLIADDSREAAHRVRNREMARDCTRRGIEAHYFGLDEQVATVAALGDPAGRPLARVVGETPRDAFFHKGPSLVRNITYLKLRELAAAADEPLLFYFIDSDQEFRVKVGGDAGDRDLYAVSYLHQLDRLFAGGDALVMTGKVVGDPPVSPAVMASNFLDDVIAFVQRLAAAGPADRCGFHAPPTVSGEGGAAYHDMAERFGFAPQQAAYDYPCDLPGEHTNADCQRHFADQLNRFFFGEHPTRKSRHVHQGAITGSPARTVYTGNYVIRPEALRYFIPFPTLRLRMAGPVLGRLIRSELGGRFVSANLPMLHQRTVRTTGQAEFRPGIDTDDAGGDGLIDLAGEFERQFYGDVMLFAIERLAADGYPQRPAAREPIMAALEATHAEMLATYNARQGVIGDKLVRLRRLLDAPAAWWNRSPEQRAAVHRFHAFVANIDHNFGSEAAGYRRINAAGEWTRRRAQMADAIGSYAGDRAAWEEALAGA